MKRRDAFLLSCIALILLLALSRCTPPKDEGKIPLTSSSREAVTHLTDGRTLFENARAAEASDQFQKALDKDPGFAMAHYYLAQSAATAREFFAHQKRAAELSANVSEGERLMILILEAGAHSNAAKQMELAGKLVAAYPRDERAHMLAGGVYYGQQDYNKAVEHLKKAVEIAPDFPPAYNLLGYASRFLKDYPEAEKAFQKYIQLIPNDPNPYDSYAELLLKLGRYDESLIQYRKALSANSRFVGSYGGIAASLMYQGKHEDSRAELQKALDGASTDAQRRGALYGMAVVEVDRGRPEIALKEVERGYAVAEKTGDIASMAADVNLMGNILLDMGDRKKATEAFKRSLQMIVDSDLSPEVKETAELFYRYDAARLAVANKDYEAAAAEAAEFRQRAESGKNPNQIRVAYELDGILASAQKRHDDAIAALLKANTENPGILYRLALAYNAKGDKEKARLRCTEAARFNGLPLIDHAFIRMKAEKMLAAL